MNNTALIVHLQDQIRNSIQVINSYDWLINSYVLDFYVDNHWDRLPSSWRSCFEQLDIRKLKHLLTDKSNPADVHCWPLSILALRALFNNIGLSRKFEAKKPPTHFQLDQETTPFRAHQRLFDKSVKLKKRHEIEKFSESCLESGRITNVNYLVDIGSGQGNLSRALTYGFGFQVCCIEQDEILIDVARLKDEEVSSRLKKQFKTEHFHHPVHISKKVNLEEIEPDQFVAMVRDSFNIEKSVPFRFGLIGLHPCGDLATFLIKLFLSCPEARFIKIVCCCYMKLSTKEDKPHNYGFPMSAFSKNSELKLTYEAREIACHAIEQYRSKLDTDYEELKVHAFRAAIEKIIVKLHPDLKHSGLKSTKVANFSFKQYCDRAVSGLHIEIPYAELECEDTLINLKYWERVVKFYTLRLMFAPLIESVILYDRWLYLLEQGISSKIDVIFDPACSPRNHALTGSK